MRTLQETHPEILVNAPGRCFAVVDRLDGGLPDFGDVSSGKHARATGLHRLFVHDQNSVFESEIFQRFVVLPMKAHAELRETIYGGTGGVSDPSPESPRVLP